MIIHDVRLRARRRFSISFTAQGYYYYVMRTPLAYTVKRLLLLLLSVHLYSALSLQIPNALHALCQYLANRKHLSDRLK